MTETQDSAVDAVTVADQERDASAVRADRAAKRQGLLQKLGIVIPFVVVLAAGILLVPNFLTGSNITNMLVNGAILAITAYGMTMVIALRGIDLSVGSTQAVVACVAAASVNAWGLAPGILAGLLAALALGLLNGIVVTTFRVPSFIATLSTMSVFRGLALLFTGGAPIMIADASFRSVATASVGGVPVPFILAVVIGAGFWFVLDRMRFGKHMVAVGGSPESATDSGINVQRINLIAYVVAALAAGVAGILLASQLGSVNGSLSTGLELQAIAVVVLGGTSMAGGRGNVIGTFLAALLLAMINSGLNLLNVASFYQYVALGVLLVFALSLDSAQRAAVRRVFEGKAS
ncbi:ribose/xylose/arabinose/galactoside ABC-type transport system permease subunit [Microbacterium sp. W4I4]|uniref:ABC transporter permease n=1 Tax=Microbacterium sp. W4I4 TaxID=3042295 RepID=UPI0027813FFC|nr:ABC transporter permease [Microbacterium sp. W4I4]MDQ0615119.1 ribose/xylose/arabinose/galactoside ABC-type transport system permease subunit [Microbacterium sp. W4I4]